MKDLPLAPDVFDDVGNSQSEGRRRGCRFTGQLPRAGLVPRERVLSDGKAARLQIRQEVARFRASRGLAVGVCQQLDSREPAEERVRRFSGTDESLVAEPPVRVERLLDVSCLGLHTRQSKQCFSANERVAPAGELRQQGCRAIQIA